MTTSQAYAFILLLPFVCTVVCYCTWHLLEYLFKITRIHIRNYKFRKYIKRNQDSINQIRENIVRELMK